jgi:hypothetical protein
VAGATLLVAATDGEGRVLVADLDLGTGATAGSFFARVEDAHADPRFSPVVLRTPDGTRVVLWTDGSGTPMRVRLARLGPTGEVLGSSVISPDGGGAAPVLGLGETELAIYLVEARIAMSAVHRVTLGADGTPSAPVVARPLSRGAELPAIAVVRASTGTRAHLAYAAVGNLATRAIGLVQTTGTDSPAPLVPGLGYGGALSVRAALDRRADRASRDPRQGRCGRREPRPRPRPGRSDGARRRAAGRARGDLERRGAGHVSPLPRLNSQRLRGRGTTTSYVSRWNRNAGPGRLPEELVSGRERPRRQSNTDGPASGRWSAELSRLIREALELVSTPEVAGRLLFDALAEARLSALPNDLEDVRSFARTELAALVTERIGADAADAMLERIELVARALARIAEHQAKARRSTKSPPRPSPKKRRDDETVPFAVEGRVVKRATEPPPASVAGSTGARVVLVSADPRLGSELRVRVSSAATVLTYRTLEELSRSPVGQVHALVLDVRGTPDGFVLSVEPSTLVLWPASLPLRDAVADRHPHLPDVRFAGDEVGIDDLATLLRLAVEAS